MKARFVKSQWENEARTILSVILRPDSPYYFTAGQYADLTVPHDNADDRGITRTMTITSSPAETLVKMTLRIPKKSSTFKQALLDLRPDTPVTLTAAMGDLVLPLDESVPLVFVAGGVAIASFVSMMSWLTEQKDARDITLLYAVRSTDDIIFQDIFDAYAPIGKLNRLLFTTDNKVDSHSWNGSVMKKRLTAQDVMKYVGPDSQIYLSGSESMVSELQQTLQKAFKIPQYRIAFDYFDGYVEL